MRVNYWQSKDWPDGGSEAAGISITLAKKLLKEKGGRAFSGFFRNYVLTGTSEIELNGDNTNRPRRAIETGGKA